MKKKIVLGILLLIGLLILTGCGDKKIDNEAESKANEILNTKKETRENKESKTLIVYFSRTGENYNVGNIKVGNTAMMASYIKEYLNADSFEIVPKIKYPDNYDKCTELAKKELNNNERPEIENTVSNFDEYDTVFIGYPIWWGDLPMVVYTFLESHDFEKKTVIPFNTHEGSGSAGTYEKLRTKLTTAKVETNGLALTGEEARTEKGKEKTIKWLEEVMK